MSMKVNGGLCVALSVVIGGCSWMGAANLPSIQSPTNFVSMNPDMRNIESLPYLAWWQQFNDKTLNGLIESALKNNMSIGMAISNAENARGQLTQVELGWVPGIGLWGGYSTNPALGTPGSFLGLFPALSLNIASQIAQTNLAEYGVKYQQSALDGARLEVISAIVAAYFTLISQQQQLVLLKQYSADLVKLVELSVKKLNIGLQSDIELSQLKSQQSLIAAQIELTKHNIQLSSNAINYLLNKNPEQVKIGGNFAQLDFSKFKPGDLPANVLQNRPDIKMAEYALQVSHAKVGIDYSNLFPNIQLDKFVAGVTGNPLVMMPNQFSQYTDAYSIWGVEPSIFGAIEADKSAYAAQVYSYVQTVRRALKDTDNAFSANNRYTKNYQEIESAYMSLNKKLTLQGNLYKNGIIAYPDLLQSKLGVDDLSILLNQAKLQQASALVSLYQQLAGGYKYKESESYNKLKIDG